MVDAGDAFGDDADGSAGQEAHDGRLGRGVAADGGEEGADEGDREQGVRHDALVGGRDAAARVAGQGHGEEAALEEGGEDGEGVGARRRPGPGARPTAAPHPPPPHPPAETRRAESGRRGTWRRSRGPPGRRRAGGAAAANNQTRASAGRGGGGGELGQPLPRAHNHAPRLPSRASTARQRRASSGLRADVSTATRATADGQEPRREAMARARRRAGSHTMALGEERDGEGGDRNKKKK